MLRLCLQQLLRQEKSKGHGLHLCVASLEVIGITLFFQTNFKSSEQAFLLPSADKHIFPNSKIIRSQPKWSNMGMALLGMRSYIDFQKTEKRVKSWSSQNTWVTGRPSAPIADSTPVFLRILTGQVLFSWFTCRVHMQERKGVRHEGKVHIWRNIITSLFRNVAASEKKVKQK